MRVLFLDIDGVLNSKHWMLKNRDVRENAQNRFENLIAQLDPIAVRLVSDFVESMNLTVVISSSWRFGHPLDEINSLLVATGWDATPAIDITPRTDSFNRGSEIDVWLTQHPEVTNHVILDDDSDFLEGQHLVQTSWETGVTHEHIDLAIGFLI